MKTKSSLESAFFNPRALVGFGFGAIGLLLGLVAFIALPTQSARAEPSPCTNVVFSQAPSQDIDGAINVFMESHNQGTTNQCTIYYNATAGLTPNPTHSSTIYTGPYVVLYGDAKFFKAFGHALDANPEDSQITGYYADNLGL